MKTSVLLYSRDCHQTSEILTQNLSNAGYQVEQSHLMNVPRIALNNYAIIHFIISKLPLTVNELICLKTAQALGRIVILSIIDSNLNAESLQLQFFRPDGFTVSQTNHLQYYRKWSAFKMILPALPILKSIHLHPFVNTTNLESFSEANHQELYIFLFSTDFSEAINFRSPFKTYFDASYLLKNHSAVSLRKKWHKLLLSGKISKNQHLILSNEKGRQIVKTKPVAVVLSNPDFLNHELSDWMELAILNSRFVFLNEHQAAGYSNYWTSGQNCFVVSESNWFTEIQKICEEQCKNNGLTPWTYSAASSSQLYDPLTNELSRLYTKILHQKTRLLRADSANI